MGNSNCPNCGQEVAHDAACRGCGHVPTNGAAKPGRRDPTPPPEVAGWVIEKTPPELAEYFRSTFDEAVYWTEFHETMRTGGANIDELIAEIERKVNGRP
jgi:hypothetical protein